MNALIISETPQELMKLINGFKKSNIRLKAVKPEELQQLWLIQYHLAQIHPSIQGTECTNIAKTIRNLSIEIPIIHSAKIRQEIPKTIQIPKNISEKELIQIYRSTTTSENRKKKLRYKGLTLNTETKTIRRENRRFKLSNREYGLIHLLIVNCEKIVSKFEIFESIWDRNGFINSNFIEVHISNLRKKIDKGFKKKLIHTIPQHGYMLKE